VDWPGRVHGCSPFVSASSLANCNPHILADAVCTRYLFTIAGVKEADLYNLRRPAQVGDVLILPVDGFK